MIVWATMSTCLVHGDCRQTSDMRPEHVRLQTWRIRDIEMHYAGRDASETIKYCCFCCIDRQQCHFHLFSTLNPYKPGKRSP